MLVTFLVKPGRKTDRVEKTEAGWVLSVRGRAQDNEANEYLVRFLGRLLGLPGSAIRIKRGQTSRHKQIEIDGEEKAVLEKLTAAAEAN